MSGLSPKFPLSLDTGDINYKLNKTYKELIAQNLKNLLLTSPGERVMEPRFGAGLRRYFFEPMLPETFMEIKESIFEQVQVYMPFIEIIEVGFHESDDISVNPNFLSVTLKYAITPLQETDVIVLENSFSEF